MNKLFLICLYLVLSNWLLAQNKKALVVTISNYPASNGLRKINSNNDVSILQSALMKLGFLEKDIYFLQEEKATKKNIIDALENTLLQSIKAGDIAYFHFSGHGQQVQDLNGDEIDGYDEALVPYDALAEYKPELYSGEQHLIDDDLAKIYSKLRTKLGSKGHLLLTIDACHSGTSTRGFGSARGNDIRIAPESYRKSKMLNNIDLEQSEPSKLNESKMSSMVAFYGSMANQLNYEIQGEDGKYYGALSYAFSKAIHSLSPQSSYQQLFDKIKLIIGMHMNNQIPESSGNLAQAVLGGKYLLTPNYFLVKEWQDSNSLIVNSGFLNGITPGTILGFYPPESRDRRTATLMKTGTVIISGSTTCTVDVPGGISKEESESSWIMVKEENFGDLIIRLKIKGKLNSLDSEILEEVFSFPYIKRVEDNPDLVLLEEDNEIIITTKNDIEVATISKSSTRNDLIYLLKNAITQFGQSQYLRKLTQENKDIAVEFEILLVARNGVKLTQPYSTKNNKDVSKSIRLKVGDEIKIKIHNVGNKPCYYTLLDIQPDNKTNVLLPKANESPSDYFVTQGNSLIIPTSFRMDIPLGQELFKLIATKNPINLRPLDQRRGISTPQERDPFEILINNSYYKNEDTSYRGINSNVPAGQVNIFSLPFIIEK